MTRTDLGLRVPFGATHFNSDALAQEIMDLGIGTDRVDRTPLAREDRVGFVKRILRQRRVQPLQREPQVGSAGARLASRRAPRR